MSQDSQDPTQTEDLDSTVAEAAAETTQTKPAAESADTEQATDDSVIEALKEEIGKLKDQALRSQAEAQNARRRAEQDVEKARKYALEKFVNELLPVADNLERAIGSVDVEDESQKVILEGVQLTHKSLLDTLKRFQVEPIDPEGEPFDPQLHQAMSMVPNPEVEPNTVLNVFQKGYTLNGRLVRPAMVVVSSAAPSES